MGFAEEEPSKGLIEKKIIMKAFTTTAERISLMHSHRVDGRLTYTEIYHLPD